MNKIIPNIKPFYKQHLCYQKLFDRITRFILFGGGAGGGKSWIGCEWLILMCYRYPGTKWFIARKELKRLMASTFVTFQKVCKFHKISPQDWKLNSKYNYIEFRNPETNSFDGMGSRIDLLDADYKPSDPMFERFGSLEYTGGWIEEAGEVQFLAFDVLKSRCGRHLNKELGLTPKMLLTCNPTKNWLYRVFYKPWRDGNMPEKYAFIQSLYKENFHTAAEYEIQLNEIKDQVTKMRLRDGIWEYSDEDTILIEYDSIIDLFTNVIDVKLDRYIVADAARYGSDRTVIGIWQGLDLYRVIIKQHQGTDVTGKELKELARSERVPYSHIIVDEDGVGGGIVDHNRGFLGFVNNSSPLETKDPVDPTKTKKENYRNLKTQCSFVLADRINTHKITVSAKLEEKDKDSLIEELGQIKKKITPDVTKLQIMSKEEVKEALGRSPDISDMMMMRMFYELKKPANSRYKAEQGFGGIPLSI